MSGRGRHAVTRRRGWRWLAGVTGLAVAGAAVLTMSPAHAEAKDTTATLTLTGVVDSNCPVSTGGTKVYVAPGGDVTFKAALAAIHVSVLGLDIPLDTAHVASFIDTLTIDGNTKDPHSISGTSSYVLKNVSGTHTFQWSATSVQLLPIPLVAPNGITVALNADTVLPSSLPVGAKLSWTGQLDATSDTNKCGIAVQVPGPGVTVGPIKTSLPPIAAPTITPPTLPDLGGLIPGGGGKTSGSGHSSAPSSGTNYTPPGLTIPEQVVPTGYGNGAGTVGGGGFGNALPDLGGNLVNGAPDSGGAEAAPSGSSSPASARVSSNAADLAANPSPSAQLPVLLAILAILALSLVTATYARLYLLRRN